MAGLVIAALLIGAGVGWAIGEPKGRGAQGAILGLVLGFIGWIIVGLMEPTDEVRQRRTAELADAIGAPRTMSAGMTRPCPWCAEDIKVAARVCRFCNRDVEPLGPDELSPNADPDTRALHAVTISLNTPLGRSLTQQERADLDVLAEPWSEFADRNPGEQERIVASVEGAIRQAYGALVSADNGRTVTLASGLCVPAEWRAACEHFADDDDPPALIALIEIFFTSADDD